MQQGNNIHSVNKREITPISVPNRTTFMEVVQDDDIDSILGLPFTATQLKIIVFILKELQKFVVPQLGYVKEFSKEQSDVNARKLYCFQKDLFSEIATTYLFKIPKKLFVKSFNYTFFKEEIYHLSAKKIKFKRRNPATKRIALYTTQLFSVYEDLKNTPSKEIYTKDITIEMTKAVVEHLSVISVAVAGQLEYDSDYYNKLIYEVILNCHRRYTGLIYFYLCGWRKQGGCRIPVDKFRTMLGLGNKYKQHHELKKYVLDSSSEELQQNGLDFWFEAAIDKDCINFKIISHKTAAMINEKRDTLVKIMKTNGMTEDDIKSVAAVIANPDNFEGVQQVVSECFVRYYEFMGTDKEIKNLSSYMVASIRKWVHHKNAKNSRSLKK